ncbi:MAG: nucleotidyltransferase domain-containing protein [Clostridiales bacterium]|nr:nucleotidyltransferase domain-containing protein [Clostridiales bacterium]
MKLATNLLKNKGCEFVFLFGSLIKGKIHEDSDIDIDI